MSLIWFPWRSKTSNFVRFSKPLTWRILDLKNKLKWRQYSAKFYSESKTKKACLKQQHLNDVATNQKQRTSLFETSLRSANEREHLTTSFTYFSPALILAKTSRPKGRSSLRCDCRKGRGRWVDAGLRDAGCELSGCAGSWAGASVLRPPVWDKRSSGVWTHNTALNTTRYWTHNTVLNTQRGAEHITRWLGANARFRCFAVPPTFWVNIEKQTDG